VLGEEAERTDRWVRWEELRLAWKYCGVKGLIGVSREPPMPEFTCSEHQWGPDRRKCPWCEIDRLEKVLSDIAGIAVTAVHIKEE
jgi:hypothetical protein